MAARDCLLYTSAAERDPTVMIGGTLPLLHAGHRVGGGDTIILESCEYHDSFLYFRPTIAVILDIEADHLDYFLSLIHIYSLRDMGALCLDCDEVYHELTETSAPLREALERRFGSVYGPDGKLERKKLGEIVFSDPAALSELNAITHSFVNEEIKRRLRRCV